MFRTNPCEKDKLVLQLGTSDPDLALEAALTVLSDVSGIDLNCGCPKKFSIQAGMGAALLSEPERLISILTKLRAGLPSDFPVTAKIRIFDDLNKTLDLAKRIVATGIHALTVHARTRDERPRQPAHWDYFPLIADVIAPVPLIANGDIIDHKELIKARQIRGVSSWMLARGAQWNVSLFRADGPLPLRQVSEAYLRLAMKWIMPPGNAKYTLMQMWMGAQELGSEVDAKEMVRSLQSAKSYDNLCKVFGIEYTGFDETESLLEAD